MSGRFDASTSLSTMCCGVGPVGIAHAHVDDVLAAATRRHLQLGGDVEDVRRQALDARELFHADPDARGGAGEATVEEDAGPARPPDRSRPGERCARAVDDYNSTPRFPRGDAPDRRRRRRRAPRRIILVVKLHATVVPSSNTFNAYGDGWVEVNAVRYERSIVVVPDRPVLDWPVTDFDVADGRPLRVRRRTAAGARRVRQRRPAALRPSAAAATARRAAASASRRWTSAPRAARTTS